MATQRPVNDEQVVSGADLMADDEAHRRPERKDDLPVTRSHLVGVPRPPTKRAIGALGADQMARKDPNAVDAVDLDELVETDEVQVLAGRRLPAVGAAQAEPLDMATAQGDVGPSPLCEADTRALTA